MVTNCREMQDATQYDEHEDRCRCSLRFSVVWIIFIHHSNM